MHFHSKWLPLLSNVSYTISHQVFPPSGAEKKKQKNSKRSNYWEAFSALNSGVINKLVPLWYTAALMHRKLNKRQIRSKCQHQLECAFAQKFNLQCIFSTLAGEKETRFCTHHFKRDLTCLIFTLIQLFWNWHKPFSTNPSNWAADGFLSCLWAGACEVFCEAAW